MNAIQDFAITVCFSAIFLGVVHFFIPKSRIRSTAKGFLCALFLFGFISSVGQVFGEEIKFPSVEEYRFEATISVEDMVLYTAKKNMETTIKQNLLEQGIMVQDISLSMDILKDNGISITVAEIYTPNQKAGDIEKIKDTVRPFVGTAAEIRIKGT